MYGGWAERCILSFLQGLVYLGILCSLASAKNSVGSCRKTHNILNLIMPLFVATYN